MESTDTRRITPAGSIQQWENSLLGRRFSVVRAGGSHIRLFSIPVPRQDALVVSGHAWSTADLLRCRDAVIAWLREEATGTRPRAIVMTPAAESIVALLAVTELDWPVVLLPSILGPKEAQEVLRSSGAKWIVTTSPLPPTWANSGGKLPVATSQREGLTLFRRIEPDGLSDPDTVLPGAVCQLTSGSMGASRLAVRSYEALTVEVLSLVEALSLGERDTVLCASSPAHSYGLVGGLLAPLAAGARAVLASGPRAIQMGLQVRRPTIVVGLGPGYANLMREGSAQPLQGVRLALSAGAPLPDGLYTRFLTWSGVPIRQDYGTTETGTIAIDASDPPAPSTVGRTLRHVEVRLARQPHEVEGERGEVLVRSSATARWYVEAGALHPLLDSDGWVHTHDGGRWDAEERLQIDGRLRPALRAGGMAIDPAELETYVTGLPGVREAVALAGVEDTIRVVVVAPSVDEVALQRQIGRYIRTDHVQVELRDELPRSPAGKILQKYL